MYFSYFAAMKVQHIFFLLALVASVAISACKSSKNGQGGGGKPSTRELPAALAAAYKEDAARLAVREATTSTTSGEEGATIPPDRIAYFYDLLTKIYWMGIDSANIPDLSGVHCFPYVHLRRILVTLTPDSQFEEPWGQGISLTSDLYVNQLFSRYGLKVNNFRRDPAGATLMLDANRDIITPALASAFSQIPGIRSAEEERMMGDGNNIEFGGEGKNQVAMRLSIGAGDCMAGCIQKKYWIFYVDAAGKVTYMGTRGSIPAELEPK
jgi:hypothetical protein